MTAGRLPPGITLIDLDTIDSTNVEARRRAEQGAEAWTLVRAKTQTGGRGRRGREWHSPPGNLFVSLILRPDTVPEKAAQISFVTALAAADAISLALPPMCELALKWPNDILVNGRKISGILLESANRPDGNLDWLIVGIGINIVEHPDKTLYPATNLHFEGAVEATRESVTVALARSLRLWMDRWQSEGFEPIRTAWMARAQGLGERLEVRLERETVRGTFADLDANGALILTLDGGGERVITAGDVFPLMVS